MRKIIWFIFLMMLVIIAGCSFIDNEGLMLSKYELKNNEVVLMNLTFNYSQIFGNPNPTSFHIQFITGKYLDVKKETWGSNIESDVLYNITGMVERQYYIVASGVYSGQQVETVQAIITSKDGSITKELRSDFILIKA